jgi:hypothetical protein
LQPFGVPIEYHQGDLRAAQWNGGPISIYVDDASKTPELFFHSLRTFGPSWQPGQTIIFLMDYDIWKTTGRKHHRCQLEFIEAHADSFEQISDPEFAIFRYRRPVDFESWIASRETFSDTEEIARQLEAKDAAIMRKMTRLIRAQEAEIKAQKSRIKQLAKQIDRLQTSTSWRVTAPIRAAANLLRGRASRGEQQASE